MKVGGVLGLDASTTIFLGMAEAPVLIKPYIRNMTRSEIFSLMTVGMACLAGTVMVLYATILKGVMSNPRAHFCGVPYPCGPSYHDCSDYGA